MINKSRNQFVLENRKAIFDRDDDNSVLTKKRSENNKLEHFDVFSFDLRNIKNSRNKPTSKLLNRLNIMINNSHYSSIIQEASALTRHYPNSFIIWNIIGVAYAELGSLNQALAAFKKVILLKPDYAEGFNNLGNILRSQGKFMDAIAAYKKALDLNPKYSSPLNNVGNILRDHGKLEEALGAYKKALELDPTYAIAHYNIGTIYKQKGFLKLAIESLQKAVKYNPSHTDAHNNLGLAYYDYRLIDASIVEFKKALSINPEFPEAYNNLGNAMRALDNLVEAENNYIKAIELDPNYATAYTNLGVILHDQGNLDRSIDAHKKAIELEPGTAGAYSNLSFVQLQTTQWKDGLELREWRWETPGFNSLKREFNIPKWDGDLSNTQDKVLLIWGEQGPGDMIIWSSCLNFYSNCFAKVILEVPLKLTSVLKNSFPRIEVREADNTKDLSLRDIDYHIPFESIYGYACLTGNISSVQDAYIIPNNERVNYWRQKLRHFTDRKCVGISWKSPVMNTSRSKNYPEKSTWGEILKLKDYAFFNLQSTDFEEDLRYFEDNFGVEVYNFDDLDHFNDLSDVAAFTKALDLTVSVATAVSTISAAVGTKTIIPTWRQSPWNNFLFSSRGPDVDLQYRDTWENWDQVFTEIRSSMLRLS